MTKSNGQLPSDISNNANGAPPTSTVATTDSSSHYNYYQTNATTYDSQYDRQHVDRLELEMEQQYGRQFQQQFNELQSEQDEMNLQLNQQRMHHELPFGKGGVIPSLIVSLAQKLLPIVTQRLNHHEDRSRLDGERIDPDDDFAGTCAPLGSTSFESKQQQQQQSTAGLKTEGLEDEHYNNLNNVMQVEDRTSSPDRTQNQRRGLQRRISDLEMGDPIEYLPQSAALLVSALQNSNPKQKGGNTYSKSSSLVDLPSLMDEAVNDEVCRSVAGMMKPSKRTDSADMESFEREAEALLESIRRGDLGDVSADGTVHDDDTRQAANYAASSDTGALFDDDDSIGGEMVRLTQSIAHLQHDLENADFSYLDEMYNDGFEGEEGGAWSRLQMWFSRGMVMEQKLLNSYGMSGNDGETSGEAPNTTRYSDNPVLVWSLALMWAFVLIIMGHSKIAEWVESEDPGQLADIVEWLFS
ncbi:predicted protein [Thalassiosira pseudonana CCMP1335]|uniref:Uncharacterized protein n=1 Tax=Thalassiosira pseudonana TaxID=35128 RepID=B8C6Y2_THAPS|nr:predicted protein [Thalassiosira pseudonana CCMP1335]EED90883.1 predicted protein [Thalassiosira pseudonana CCMP1335]